MTIIALRSLTRAIMTKRHLLGPYSTEIHLPTVAVLEARSPGSRCHRFASLGLQMAIFELLFPPHDFYVVRENSACFLRAHEVNQLKLWLAKSRGCSSYLHGRWWICIFECIKSSPRSDMISTGISSRAWIFFPPSENRFMQTSLWFKFTAKTSWT